MFITPVAGGFSRRPLRPASPASPWIATHDDGRHAGPLPVVAAAGFGQRHFEGFSAGFDCRYSVPLSILTDAGFHDYGQRPWLANRGHGDDRNGSCADVR